MKKIVFGLALILLSVFVKAQNGLENIVVEKYYISNAADSIGSSGTLPVGSVTYRIYADMLPGFTFQMAYGNANHNLKFTTTTSFFNNTDYGSTTPNFSKTNARKNTVMLDSWLSVGAACNANFGVLKSEDNGVSNVVNLNGLLANTDTSMGIPLTSQDGFYAGSPQSVTMVGITNQADVFGDGTANGNSFILNNAAWSSLNGSTGPTSTNRVLIAQITTNGAFHYEINIQIGTPTGGVQNYVSSNPTLYNGQMELTMPSLTGTFNGPPTAFAVTGTGTYCPGGSGLAVGLASSEVGVTYKITPGNFTVAGTGSAITFGLKTAGTYTITGTNSKGTTSMTGSAIITAAIPATPIVSVTNNCGNSVFSVSNLVTGASLAWFNGVILLGSGNNLQVTSSVTLTAIQVSGSCQSLASNAVTSNPVQAVVPSVSISGNNIIIAGSYATFTATPINGGTPTYQWKVNGANVGSPTNVYTYYPLSGDVVSCTMTSNLACITTSTVNSNNISVFYLNNYNVTGSGSYCSTSNGLTIGLSGSQIGVNYQLVKNGINDGNTLAGTGNALSWINKTAGTYTVLALAGSASQPMNGNAIITSENPIVASITINTSSTNLVLGDTAHFTATPTNEGLNPTYQWKVNGINKGTNSNMFSYAPTANDTVICVLTSSITSCIVNNPATSNSIVLTVNQSSFKTLNVIAMLQNFYNGVGLPMNQAMDMDMNSGEMFNKFQTTVVDTLQLLIVSADQNLTVEYEFDGMNLNQDGTITPSISIPNTVTGFHYIVINHRNSIETWSDSVNFASSVINYNFYTHPISTLFVNNMLVDNIGGSYNGSLIYGGDISNPSTFLLRDGTINIFDLSDVFDAINDPTGLSSAGYVPDDLTGDGVVNIFDLSLVFDNLNNGAGSVNPYTLKKKK